MCIDRVHLYLLVYMWFSKKIIWGGGQQVALAMPPASALLSPGPRSEVVASIGLGEVGA